jgi:rfaE bifunctional protein nucleotidyltransferase chain/domain
VLASPKGSGIQKDCPVIRVLASGCFDPFHYGHLVHLQQARRLGDHLTVAVTADSQVNKGPGRPIFNQFERAAVLRNLRCVDNVIIVASGAEAIEMIEPDIFVKGKEYEGKLPEQRLVESYGGKVFFTDGDTYSSTQLVTGGYFTPQGVGNR